MGNKNLSPTHFKVLLALWDETGRKQHRKREDGLFPIWEPRIEELAGLSHATVSRAIQVLAQSKIVLKRVEYTDEKKHLFLALSQQTLERPETLTLKEGRKHGGLRCECGGRLVPTEYTCEECGQVYRKRKKSVG